ncbi:hypothetical protein [Archaeoglobus veneficus]|uniref:Uncharacterized protein n=1 Tax=Archaeoglobus veneficus (strain DSM 11195 / SNP6) TaxID=693661 RepID=F2KPP4_ARCVS|nr:hypothetical protein [Archaeoglobus veneficus]AEA47572.1 hypothetical protein Arcve_1572 [Archaeoglobus veneficus SNP6]
MSNLRWSEFIRKIEEDEELQNKIKEDPVAAIREVAATIPEPLRRDVWIYRIVVIALGLTVLAVVIGAIVITMVDKTTPDVLVALGSAAVGALAGLLAPSPAGEG